jgi:hypothetical protein
VRDDISCEVDLANSPVFHFKKYAHVKFSEIQEKISEQGALKEESRLKYLWNKRIDTDGGTPKKNALCLFCGTPKSSENNF